MMDLLSLLGLKNQYEADIRPQVNHPQILFHCIGCNESNTHYFHLLHVDGCESVKAYWKRVTAERAVDECWERNR